MQLLLQQALHHHLIPMATIPDMIIITPIKQFLTLAIFQCMGHTIRYPIIILTRHVMRLSHHMSPNILTDCFLC
jgi:hypothetical protein